jgi:hypothetical protein
MGNGMNDLADNYLINYWKKGVGARKLKKK